MTIDWRARGWTGPLLVAGCGSAGVRPGLGDLSFRLTWTGAADLDLYVLSPLEERICFLDRSSPSGRELDVDCNLWSREPCALPMKNDLWRRSAAPKGVCRDWVTVADGEGATDENADRVEVRQERRIVSAGCLAKTSGT